MSNLNPENEFEKMLNEYNRKIDGLNSGEIVEGTIIKIKEDHLLVDVGTRCEGIVPKEEVLDKEGNIKFKEGDKILVEVISSGKTDFSPRLSHKNAMLKERMKKLRESFKKRKKVKGKVKEVVKGGLKIDMDGIEAFMPASQVDLKYTDSLDNFVGKELEFKIEKFNPKNIVVSRRVVLEEERERKEKEFWENLNVGNIVEGKIKQITKFGVFVDLGLHEGLVHISNISWDMVEDINSLFKIGDVIRAKVIDIDRKNKKIGLSIKDLKEDPWNNVEEKYKEGQIVKGKVVKLEKFGAFISLEEGIRALAPISELSWKKIKHPKEVIDVNDMVEGMIVNVDKENKRISISVKKITPHPFEEFLEKYKIGDIIEGEIKTIMPYGLFVKLDEGVEGLLHISELPFTGGKKLEELYKKGEKIEVKIIKVDKEGKKISLSSLKKEEEEKLMRDKKKKEEAEKAKELEEEKKYIASGSEGFRNLGEIIPKDILEKFNKK